MRSIIFFDDQCPLCIRTVNFLHKQDSRRRLQFASLEGKTAHTYLTGKRAHYRTLNTVVLFELPSEQITIRGRAVFSILGKLGGLWSLIGWMRRLPFIDHVYRFIAHHRKRSGSLPKIRASLLP